MCVCVCVGGGGGGGKIHTALEAPLLRIFQMAMLIGTMGLSIQAR